MLSTNQAQIPRSPSLFFQILAGEGEEGEKSEQTIALEQHSVVQDSSLGASSLLNGVAADCYAPGVAVAAAGLTTGEVLQELLGDLYVEPSRLQLGEQLGEGGFAVVRRATLDRGMCMREAVAVKSLLPEVLAGPQDLREFLTEANLLRKLSHPNIVRLVGVGSTNVSNLDSARQNMFVVQELMPGGDLKQKVVEQMLSGFTPVYTKAEALHWALDITEAMYYLHSVCKPMVIHRDLKLENILLTKSELGGHRRAKLADFGLHKRVFLSEQTGMLEAWARSPGHADGDKSYYGGDLYRSTSLVVNASSGLDPRLQHTLALMADVNDSSVHRKVEALLAIERTVHGVGKHGEITLVTEEQRLTNDLPRGDASPRRQPGAGAADAATPKLQGKATGSLKYLNATQKVGSLAYMAPEVLQGGCYNERVDVFAFGVILYELFSAVAITSKLALGGGDAQSALQEYADSVAAGQREVLPPHWPPALRKLVGACWAQDPAARPDFSSVLRALQMLEADGAVARLDELRPRGDYDPIHDCGCHCCIS